MPDTVYVNDHNIVEDVYGSAFYRSVPLALNNAGQVLWTVNTLDGKWSIYLSTPVPEPGAIAAVGAVLLLLTGRARWRVRAR